MKSVVVYRSEETKLSLYTAVGLPDPNFYSCFPIGTEPGQVHPDKVAHLKNSGPFTYQLGVELIDDDLMSPSHALLLCDADHVYLDFN
jgi:hypothetical protein